MTWLPDDPQLQSIALAFLHQMTNAILIADGELSPSELAFLEQEFPAPKLMMAGFLRPNSRAHTFEYFRAAARGFTELPAKLDKAGRAALFDQLKRAATSSGDISPDESEILIGIKAMFSR